MAGLESISFEIKVMERIRGRDELRPLFLGCLLSSKLRCAWWTSWLFRGNLESGEVLEGSRDSG